MASPHHDHYYDSARDKPDKTEFGSLRMPVQEKRAPVSPFPWMRVVSIVIAVVVLILLAKRLFA
jgi:hypothetical protein